jgi:hypothetical protein
MLPMQRQNEYLYSVPKFDLKKSDIKDFNNERVPSASVCNDFFFSRGGRSLDPPRLSRWIYDSFVL